jgi:hypothetical protein
MPALNEILVFDATSRVLLGVAPSGAVSVLGPTPPAGRTLQSVVALGAGFLLAYSDKSMSLTDAFCRNVVLRTSANTGPADEQDALGGLWTWTVTKDDEIVGYGTLDLAKGGYALGFVAAHLNEKGTLAASDAKLVKAMSNSSAQFYTNAYNYVTANDVGAFVVAMEGEASIYWYKSRSEPPTQIANAIPPTYRHMHPFSTALSGPSDEPARYNEIEQRTMPVGLYGKGRFLYLLTREPGRDRHGTVWLLHKIDPRSGGALGSVRLPTEAPHISLVTAPENWYILEEGRATEKGELPVTSMVDLPAEWIEDLGNTPLRGVERSRVACVDISERRETGGRGVRSPSQVAAGGNETVREIGSLQ